MYLGTLVRQKRQTVEFETAVSPDLRNLLHITGMPDYTVSCNRLTVHTVQHIISAWSFASPFRLNTVQWMRFKIVYKVDCNSWLCLDALHWPYVMVFVPALNQRQCVLNCLRVNISWLPRQWMIYLCFISCTYKTIYWQHFISYSLMSAIQSVCHWKCSTGTICWHSTVQTQLDDY